MEELENMPLSYLIKTETELNNLVTLLNASGSDYTALHTRLNRIKTTKAAGEPIVTTIQTYFGSA